MDEGWLIEVIISNIIGYITDQLYQFIFWLKCRNLYALDNDEWGSIVEIVFHSLNIFVYLILAQLWMETNQSFRQGSFKIILINEENLRCIAFREKLRVRLAFTLLLPKLFLVAFGLNVKSCSCLSFAEFYFFWAYRLL